MIISVIISSYNEEKYISRCLNSLTLQVLDHGDMIEIIVVDDGSKDKTRDKVKKFPAVKLLNQDHQGAGVARNMGVRFCRGEIVVFVDADMEFEKEFIRNLCNPIKNNEAKGTFSRDEFVANWDNPIARCWNWNQNLPAKRRLSIDAQGTDFRAILIDEFKRVDGFDKGGYTDTWSLTNKLGYEPTAVNNAIYFHYNPDSWIEVFENAKWVGKRRYKLGILGILITLFRVSLPVSIIRGIIGIFIYKESFFLPYKIVWDWGITSGLIKYAFDGKGEK